MMSFQYILFLAMLMMHNLPAMQKGPDEQSERSKTIRAVYQYCLEHMPKQPTIFECAQLFNQLSKAPFVKRPLSPLAELDHENKRYLVSLKSEVAVENVYHIAHYQSDGASEVTCD